MQSPKPTFASNYLQRLLPEDSSPRLHHIHNDPEKAYRMMKKSSKKFSLESKQIQSEIDYDFLEKVRNTYLPRKPFHKTPSLSPKPERSHSTMPRVLNKPNAPRSLSRLNLPRNRLKVLNELIVDYSAATKLEKSAQRLVQSKSQFSELKEKAEWAARDEATEFPR
jgi:hypothetical protein